MRCIHKRPSGALCVDIGFKRTQEEKMKCVIRFLAMIALFQFLLLPSPLFAGDQVPTEKEIMQAGN